MTIAIIVVTAFQAYWLKENYIREKKNLELTTGNAFRKAVLGLQAHKLSYRENELLKILYENCERIIDRKGILMLLWGYDNFFNSRNLDVYITKLRSYLKGDTSLEIITIKGIGYRFVSG